MDISSISGYLYNIALNSDSNVSTTQSTSTSEGISETTDFASALDEEVSKITEFKELANALDGSVLESMTANASDSDLATLSDDLLGTGGGREVLAKLMDGHFKSIAMTDSDDDSDSDNSDSISDSLTDTYSETVSDTETLLNNLQTIASNMSTDAE